MFIELQQLNMDSESESRTMKKSVSYMVTDDLLVTTGSITSGIDLLKGKIEDIGVLEDRVVDIGLDELRSSCYLASSPCSNFDFNNTIF